MRTRARISLAVLPVSVMVSVAGGLAGSARTLSAQEIQRPVGGIRPESPPLDGLLYGHHAFYWTRAIYSDGGGRRRGGYGFRGGYGGGYGSWHTDAPKADLQFLVVLQHMIQMDMYEGYNPVSLADPNLRRYPVIYAVEVGHMDLTEAEVHGLRDYLNAGGFLIVDDFWGSWEWDQFEVNMRRVLPGRPIVELPMDHPIFSTYYPIDSILQVPNIRNAEALPYGGHTWEQDGYVPHVRGIFDDKGRLMVVINWNTDLGDAWEWAEQPVYPLVYSTYACKMAANMIVYGMSH